MIHLAISVLLFTIGAPALAQQEPVHVEYWTHASCPSREEFLDEIRARTSLARFVEDAAEVRRITIEVRREGGRIHGRLAVIRGDRSGTPREIAADNCSAVVSALALIAALAIDPHASTAPAPEMRAKQSGSSERSSAASSSLPTGTPVPESPSKTLPASLPASAEPPSALTPAPVPSPPGAVARASSRPPNGAPAAAPASFPGALLAGVRAGAAIWPESVIVPFGSGSISVEWDALGQKLWSPAVRASFTGAVSPTVPATTGQIGFWRYAGELDLCPIRLALLKQTVFRPCAGLELGEITAQARGDATYTHMRAPQKLRWVAARQTLRVQQELSDRFRLEIDASLAEPLELYEFIFQVPQDAPIARMPTVIPSVAAGVAMRFW